MFSKNNLPVVSPIISKLHSEKATGHTGNLPQHAQSSLITKSTGNSPHLLCLPPLTQGSAQQLPPYCLRSSRSATAGRGAGSVRGLALRSTWSSSATGSAGLTGRTRHGLPGGGATATLRARAAWRPWSWSKAKGERTLRLT